LQQSMSHKLHYAWVVAAITFVTLVVTAAVRATPSILIVPIEHEFGWSATTVSSAVSINLLLYGLMGPFAAGLLNRYGSRRVMIVSLAFLAAGVALTTLVHTPWQLILLWGLIVGMGTGMTAIVLGATVVHRWFRKEQGLLIGILTASTATGQLLFLPILALFAQGGGWRNAVGVVVCALVFVLAIVVLWMRTDPSDLGLRPFGEKSGEVASTAHNASDPFRQAIDALRRGMRSSDFWLLAGSFFICGASTNGLIGTHLIPACMDHGMPEVYAAGLVASMGVFDLIGTTASGWLSDRFSNRWLLFTYYGLRGISLLVLPSAFDPTYHRLSIFAVFYGLDWIATVPPTVALTAKIFGTREVGLIFGWVIASHQVGAAAVALFAGFIRSIDGSYDLAFSISGIACIAAAVGVLLIGRTSDSGFFRRNHKIEQPATAQQY
jgi:sugar phosphate permease